MPRPFFSTITIFIFISLRTVLPCSSGSYLSQCLSSCQTCSDAIENCEICEAPPCQACAPRQVFQPRVLILTCSEDNKIKLIDLETKANLLTYTQSSDDVKVAKFSPLGNLMAAGDYGNFLWLYEPFTKQVIKKWTDFTDWIIDLSFSPDQSKLVAVGDFPGDKSIKIFNLATKNLIGYILNPHSGWEANSVDYNPKNKNFASTGSDKLLNIWDDTSLTNILSFEHDKFGKCTRFNSDGSKIAVSTGFPDSSIYIWDLVTNDVCPIKSASGHSGSVTRLDWSPKNNIIVAASDSDIKIWNPSDGSLVATLPCDPDYYETLKFSPDGSKIMAAGQRAIIYFWDELGCPLPSLQINTQHTDNIKNIDVFPSKNCFQYTIDCPICITSTPKCTSCKLGWKAVNYDIITASNDGNLRTWDEFSNPLLTLSSTHLGGPTTFSSSPDFTKFASAGYDLCDIYIKLSAYPSGNVIWEIQHAHMKRINSIVFSPDGNWIASASTDKTVKIWNVQTRCLTMVFFENTGGILLSRFYNTGLKLISFSDDNIVTFWDLTTGRKIREEIICPSIICADLSPDNSLVAVVSQDNYINMMNTETWTVLYSLLVSSYPVVAISFSPDGTNFATGHSDNSVKIWDTDTGCLLHTFVGHTASVLTLRYFPDGKKLATGSGDNTLKIWDIENKILLETLSGHTGAVFATDVVKRPRCQEIPLEHCNTYGDLRTKCTKCDVNYYLFDKNEEGFYSQCIHKDISLPTNVIISKPDLDGTGVVIYCSNDMTQSYTLNKMGTCTSCSNVLSNCLKCSSYSVCTLCETGYFLKDNMCLKCHKKCLTCSSFRRCTSCVNGGWSP